MINSKPCAYAIGRSLIALSLLLTLIFNPPSILFHPTGMNLYPPDCTSSYNFISLFCVFYGNYFISYSICIFILLLTIAGWRPRITGLLLFYVIFSITKSATLLEGGEQIASNICFLLLPITLLDSRKNHWQGHLKLNEDFWQKHIVSFFILMIKIQVAIIYADAAISKFGVADWQNGTALYYIMNSDWVGLSDFMKPIFGPLFSNPISLALFTHGTIVVELCLFAGIFASEKNKKILFKLGVFFHLGIGLLLGLITFSLIMIACLILFLLPWEIKKANLTQG